MTRRSLALLAVVVLASATAAWVVWRTHRAESAGHRASWALTARDVRGAPNAVDPITLAPVARDQVKLRPNVVGEPELVSIGMTGVAPTGLMDLERCRGSIEYQFRATTASGEWLATAMVVTDGMHTPVLGGSLAAAYRVPRAKRTVLPTPHCTLAQVWNAATAAGAKEDACASVTYRSRPSYFVARGWAFRGGGVDIVVDDDTCAAARSPEEMAETFDRDIDKATQELIDNASVRPRDGAAVDAHDQIQKRLDSLRDQRSAARNDDVTKRADDAAQELSALREEKDAAARSK
jgi:hypothetical protein